LSRVQAAAEGTNDLDRVWGLRAEYYAIFMADYNASLERGDPVLVELARLRIAQLVESEFDQALRYQPATDAGLTEEKIRAVADYPTSDLFDERERAVLEFAEQFAIQSSSICDQDCDRVQQHVTPEEFIYLTKALGVVDQFARVNSALKISPAPHVPATLPSFVVAPGAPVAV
jgi:alkylhydroperoxidase family enzyme